MGNSRSIVEEILAIQRRRGTNSVQTELYMRLIHVRRAFKECDKGNLELLRYFPIALVACIESFFRLAIRQLIDSGEPYLSNAQSLASKNVTFEVLKAFQGQSIKVGDVIAHSVSLSNLGLIETNMTQLMGFNFLHKVSNIHERWAVEIDNKPKKPIISDAARTFRYVSKTFELRHIFCHETASRFEWSPKEIEHCLHESGLFLKASDELISETLRPNAPLTQAEINLESARELRAQKQRLDAILHNASTCNLTKRQADRLHEAIEAWHAFRAAIVEVEGLGSEGGSIRPAIENSAAAQLTKETANYIESLLRRLGNY